MRRIERRLRKLEARFPPREEPSEFQKLLPFMTSAETHFLAEGFLSGLGETPEFQAEFAAIAERARQRQEEGCSETLNQGSNQEIAPTP